MSELAGQRPHPARLLASLKDFQRRTVEHVHHRFFLDERTTNRFLVADEVGLGKTLVARGVTALALDHLWEETERLDVVYVCSNAEIAQQNIRRLRVSDDDYARPTRLTLLPREIHGLRDRKLNFVSLTPGTSFDPHSAMGKSDERAVLYLMLERAWDFRGKAPLNVFCGYANRDGFASRVRWLRSLDDIDEELEAGFLEAVTSEERENAGDGSLRDRFEELLSSFARRDSQMSEEQRTARRDLISDLRALLGRTCIRALEPDLVILDEFQRFKHLLASDTEAGELARLLFDYVDPDTGQTAKTLLLSATPYKAYATSADQDGDSHHEDFIATVEFLLDDRATAEELRGQLARFRSILLRWQPGSEAALHETKTAIEGSLRGVIARTERLAASPDRNGMLRQVETGSTELLAGDLDAYLLGQRVADAVEHSDTIEYWKSAPYLLNLMDDYKLKRDFTEALADGTPQAAKITEALREHSGSLLSWADVAAYRVLDPQNARMRCLVSELLDRDAWRLLWLAPSLPYYKLGGQYANAEAQKMTKRLVFSSWTVVPKAISAILSYEAERRMMLAGDAEAQNDPATRRNRGALLRITIEDDRPTGMPVLALMYPSFALAELADPAALAAESGEGAIPLERALELVAERLREPVGRLTSGAPERGPADERWLWAAPLMLDAELDGDVALGWIRDPDVVDLSRGEGDGSGSAWAEHLREAEEAMLGELDPPLGRPPDDLLQLLGRLALAGPGVAALRALGRGAAIDAPARDPRMRMSAIRVGWSFRTLFNLPEVSELVRSRHRNVKFWRQALRYCVEGCLQAVLDEYAHVLREHLGHVGAPLTPEVSEEIASATAEAIGIRTTRAQLDIIETGRKPKLRTERMRARFALRFGEQHAEEGAELARADHVRGAFNSPFWPFVLATTSVGQEGLDFHLYCHAVVHWNLPSNPVDLEQREGRIHRYKGHAVRRNLAAVHGRSVLTTQTPDPWSDLFVEGEADRPADQTELWPYWIYDRDGGSESAGARGVAQIERHVLALPLSRDRARFEALLHALTLYRSVLGQARQEDLVHLLAERVPVADRELVAELLRVDLSPPRGSPRRL